MILYIIIIIKIFHNLGGVSEACCPKISIQSNGEAKWKQRVKLGIFYKSSIVHNDRCTYVNENKIGKLYYDPKLGWAVS